MKLRLENLACETFDLRTLTGATMSLLLEKIEEGCGTLEFHEGLTVLSGLAIRKLLATMEFPLTGGRIYSEEVTSILHLRCDGRIRNGFVGEVQCSIAESKHFCVSLEDLHAKGHLVAEGLSLKLDGRGGNIEVATLTVKNLQCTLGPLLLRIGVLTVKRLSVAWDEGRPRIEASGLHANDLQCNFNNTSIRASAIDLPAGLTLGDKLFVEQVHVGTIELEVFFVDEENQSSTNEYEQNQEFSEDIGKNEKSLLSVDMGVLDTLNGRVEIDLGVSATLPLIGKRQATHHFRVNVEGGMIDYTEVERGLSDLEDAFLDIRLRGDQLVLERDIPLIPGLQKPIVRWPLEPGEIELASQHYVRLRTLAKMEMIDQDDPEEKKKSKVKLHKLGLHNLNVHLSLDESAVLSSGEGVLRAHIDDLDVQGELQYAPADEEEEVGPGKVNGTASGLGLVAKDLILLNHRLSACLTIAEIGGGEIHFDNLKPKQIKLIVKKSNLSHVFFDLDPIS